MFQSIYLPPFNAFHYFLEGQVHKDSKLEIITNVGKNTLAKAIFLNIHKISDACEKTVLVDTSWLHNAWEMFLLFIKFKFPWENGVYEKIKAHLP